MAVRRSLLLKALAAFVALVALACFTSGWWLPAMGHFLVWDDGPAKADAAVVLAGDYSGNRIIGAAELAKQGYVPIVLVSGPPGAYETDEAEMAIHFIVRHGYPAQWFVPVKNSARSTFDEAHAMLDEMQRRNIRSFILVTSNFHTRRARQIYLRVEKLRGGGPPFRIIPAPDDDFDPNSWWRTRQGRKTAFFEWTKTLTSVFGI